MGYFVKNSTLVKNLSVAGCGSDKVQNISNFFRSRLFWFWPYKQHGINGRHITASRTQACKHTDRNVCYPRKMILNKHNSDGFKTYQAVDTHLKHKKRNKLSQLKENQDMDTHLSPLNTNQARDMCPKHTEEINSRQQATVLVFDIETTGFGNAHKIIEFAARDIAGGEYSTFQSLVNPEEAVHNEHIHHISTQMVNRPDVPRWKDLVPILIKFVRSRQKAGCPVIWVAHNCRTFDARFIALECNRCSVQIPSDWLFVDTCPLARELMRLNGVTKSSVKLASLREYYKISLLGPEHRAMSDVNVLALVLKRITFDLKLTVSDLLQKAFKISDIQLNSSSSKP